jgi:hypothetical protein
MVVRNEEWRKQKIGSEHLAAWLTLLSCLAYSSTMNMMASRVEVG